MPRQRPLCDNATLVATTQRCCNNVSRIRPCVGPRRYDSDECRFKVVVPCDYIVKSPMTLYFNYVVRGSTSWHDPSCFVAPKTGMYRFKVKINYNGPGLRVYLMKNGFTVVELFNCDGRAWADAHWPLQKGEQVGLTAIIVGPKRCYICEGSSFSGTLVAMC